VISIDGSRAVPKVIGREGGDVTAVFSAHSIGGASRLTARYRLFATDPYAFANPPPDQAKEAFLAAAAVGPDSQEYPKPLTIVRQGAGADVVRLDIRLEVQEVGAQGQPIGAPEEDIVSVTVALDQALKQMRAAQGMSQQDLADRLGVSPSTVSRLERGGAASDQTMRKVEDVL